MTDADRDNGSLGLVLSVVLSSSIDAEGTGPFTHPFARLLALLTHSLTTHCSLPSLVPLRSFIRLLAHSLPSSGERKNVCELNALISYDFKPMWDAFSLSQRKGKMRLTSKRTNDLHG